MNTQKRGSTELLPVCEMGAGGDCGKIFLFGFRSSASGYAGDYALVRHVYSMWNYKLHSPPSSYSLSPSTAFTMTLPSKPSQLCCSAKSQSQGKKTVNCTLNAPLCWNIIFVWRIFFFFFFFCDQSCWRCRCQIVSQSGGVGETGRRFVVPVIEVPREFGVEQRCMGRRL